MPNDNSTMGERFDDNFTTKDWSGSKRLNMFCVSNMTKESPVFGEDEDILVTKHKQFVQDEIGRAVGERETQIYNSLACLLIMMGMDADKVTDIIASLTQDNDKLR